MIESYLESREFAYWEKSRMVTAGVPQGSVLDPALWNIYFEEVLELKYKKGEELVYADDIIMIVMENYVNELNTNANKTLT